MVTAVSSLCCVVTIVTAVCDIYDAVRLLLGNRSVVQSPGTMTKR